MLFEKLLSIGKAAGPTGPFKQLYTWGLDSSGQLGDGDATFTSKSSPIQIGSLSWKQIALGDAHSVAIRSDNTLWAWGSNATGQIGVSQYLATSQPLIPAAGTASWSSITYGTSYGMGIKTDGSLWGWGTNTSGQLGDSSVITRSSPVKIGSSSWSMVSAGLTHTIGLTTDGNLWGWGLNTSGQVGISSLTSPISRPVLVSGPALTSWISIGTGGTHSFAITTNNTLYGWGLNTSGQVGIGTQTTVSTPTLVSGPSGVSWASVTAGVMHTNALDIYYNLYSWGGSLYGQLGNGMVGGAGGNNIPMVQAAYDPTDTTSSWNVVSAGVSFGMGIKADGSLWGWGLNSSGQLGDGTPTSRSSPVRIGSSSWSVVSCGSAHSLGITTDGRLFGWGLNTSGQTGINSTAAVSSPVQVAGPTAGLSWTAVAAGGSHSLGISTAGRLYAWGQNTSGQVGISALTTKSSAVLVSGPATTSWSMIAAGGSFSFAITTTGLLYAWGQNTSGQLGNATLTTASTPVQITLPAGRVSWTMVAAGTNFSFGITDTNALYQWGAFAYAGGGSYSSPVAITATSSYTAVYAGPVAGHILYSLAASPTVLYGAGLNTSAQIAVAGQQSKLLTNATLSPTVMSTLPAPTTSLSVALGDYHSTVVGPKLWGAGQNIIAETGVPYYTTIPTLLAANTYIGTGTYSVASGANHTILMRPVNGQIIGWGLNSLGELGMNNVSIYTMIGSTPYTLTGIPNGITKVISSSSANHTFAIDTAGILYGWGLNANRQLGINSATAIISSPVIVSGPSATSWIAVAAGDTMAGAITTGGVLYGWGLNTSGQTGVPIFSNSPIQVGTSSWAAVSAGTGYTLGIRGDGTLWAWGVNNAGQIGNNTLVDVSSPVLVSGPATTSWSMITAGSSFAAAIASTGALYTWGLGTSGQLGNSSTATQSSPVPIGNSSWSMVSAGGQNFMLGILTTGQLYAWGNNTYDQLGNTTITQSSSPTLVSGPSGASWSVASAGGLFGLAITTAGVLYSWGSNQNGQIGVFSTNTGTFSSPVQVSTPLFVTPSWVSVSVGASHAAGVQSDYSLWTWGQGTLGQIGDGTNVAKSSPVKIGSSSWSAVSAGQDFTLALTSDSKLYAWGMGLSGQLGNLGTTPQSSPVLVSGPAATSWIAVAAGNTVGMAITSANTLYGWGANLNGTNGLYTSSSSSPVAITGIATQQSWRQVSVGDKHTLAIKSDYSMWAWGDNQSGQLGDPTLGTQQIVPAKIGSSSWTVVAAGYSYSMGITSTGILYAWGLGTTGQLGINSAGSVSSPVIVSGPTGASWSSVAAGMSHAMALTTAGVLYSWGANTNGGPGNFTNGAFGAVSIPVQVAGVGTTQSWTQLALGGAHTLAIKSDGSLWAWGINTSGQLGNGTQVTKSLPVQIPLPGFTATSWISVTAGRSHSMGITNDGMLWAWGTGSAGQIGIGTTPAAVTLPTLVSGPAATSWTSVAAGDSHSMALATNGTLYGWGYNFYGQAGINSSATSTSTPIAISSVASLLPSWSSAATGQAHTLAIQTDGSLWAWGINSGGELGDGTNVAKSSPVKIGTSSWSSVAAGQFHSLGLTADGKLYAWGLNTNGALGINSLTTVSSPVLVSGPAATSWNAITAGLSHSMGITTAGTLYGWGVGTSGQNALGGGSSSSPVAITTVGTAASWLQISIGTDHGLGIRSDGSLWTWGNNPTGALGDGTIVAKSSPSKVGSSSWSAVAAGGSFSLGINSIGQLYGWGLNTNGQLGIGSVTTVSSPVAVTGPAAGTSWTAVSAGASHSQGITTTGALYGWGWNYYGQLGIGSVTTVSSPVAVTGPAAGTSWTKVAAGGSHSLGISTAGRLYAWGLNTSGQVGISSLTSPISSPVLVSGPATTSWAAVAAGSFFSLAIATTGVLYGWGQNTSGQVGINSVTTVSSPVIVSGPAATSWSMIAAGSESSFGMAISTTGGILFGWGTNTSGQVGVFTLTSTSSPVIVTTSIASPSWTAVSAGQYHSLGITTAGQLYTWGLNSSGQLGIFTTRNWFTPTQVALPPVSWNTVSGGGSHTMGITSTGQLYAWGSNLYGALGNLSTTSVSSAVLVSGPAATSWKSVSAGATHTLALTTAGGLYGWGLGSDGQLTTNVLVFASSPVLLTSGILSGSAFLSANTGNSATHTVAVTSSTTTYGGLGNWLFAWGYNTSGQVGIGTTTSVSSAAAVQTNTSITFSWTSVAAGANHTLAITTAGALWAWGAGANYALGDPLGASRYIPNQMTYVANSWQTVSAGVSHSMGITTTGQLWGWGSNTSGQVGIGSLTTSSVPSLVGVTQSWTSVAAGQYHTLAYDSTGTLWGWGLNTSGQVGIASLVTVSSPVIVSGPTGASWTFIGTGPMSITSGAITTTKLLYDWGGGSSGQLGNGVLASVSSPIALLTPGTTLSWTAVSAGTSHTLAINTAGQLYAWGQNTAGQIGDTTLTTRFMPTLVSGPATTSWSLVATGGSHSLAVTNTGALYGWGLNTSGQVGINSLVSVSSPVLVSGFTGLSWNSIGAGALYSIGTLTNGILYTWGAGVAGELGTNSVTSVSLPTIVSGPAATSWTLVATGNQASHASAITSGSLLYTWGYGLYAMLGIGSTNNFSSPMAVYTPGATASWVSVSVGAIHALGITTTGQMYGWGTNTVNQVGDLSSINKYMPTLVSGPAGASWSSVAAGGIHSLAITTLGALYAWGSGGNGQVGNGQLVNISSPVQIGSSSWTAVMAASAHSLAITSTGVLYAWGFNTVGQLGNLSTTQTSSPVLVSGPVGASWKVVASSGGGGASDSMAISSGSLLYGWGLNTSGQAGIPSLTTVSSPVVVNIISSINISWTAVSATANNSYGIGTNGALYAWGFGTVGGVGALSTLNTIGPVLVSGPAATSWSALGSGPSASHAAAITR